MAATTGFVGFGSVLKIGDGGGTEAFNSLGNIISITPHESTLGTVDATHMESLNYHEEVLPTIFRTSPVQVQVQWDPTNTYQAQALTDHQARTLRNFKIVFSNAATSEFAISGYIVKWAVGEATAEGIVPLSLEIKPTGKPTFTV